MIVYKKGDVLNSGETLIVHGCNCFCTMGSGIAGQIRRQYPEATFADDKTAPGDETKLGTYTWAMCKNKTVIINAYTQYKFGTDEVHADYGAIETALTQIVQDFKSFGKPIAMPKIGCGLAGGDWTVVEEILQRIVDRYNARFNVYEWE